MKGSPNFQTRWTNIKVQVVFFLSFLATKNGKISAVWRVFTRPLWDLDEGQSEFPDLVNEYKSTSCCPFSVTKNGEITLALSERVSRCLPAWDLDEGQSEFPDPTYEYKSASFTISWKISTQQTFQPAFSRASKPSLGDTLEYMSMSEYTSMLEYMSTSEYSSTLVYTYMTEYTGTQIPITSRIRPLTYLRRWWPYGNAKVPF